MTTQEQCKALNNSAVCGKSSGLRSVMISYNHQLSMWEVMNDYEVTLSIHITLTIPKGFIFDLASIPRYLWGIIAPFELSIVAPLVHDYMYYHGGKIPYEQLKLINAARTGFTRKEADSYFYSLMLREGIKASRAMIAYRAVRIFGRMFWDVKQKKLTKFRKIK